MKLNKIISLILRGPYQLLFFMKLLFRGSIIMFPIRGNTQHLFHSRNVNIGKRVFIGKRSWLSVKNDACLKIGDGTVINSDFVIACCKSIDIGRNVLFADRVFIGDSDHGFENLSVPIKDQPMVGGADVEIEDDCWIGINAIILKGVTIGRHSIVGAGSIVTKSIPPNSIAVGIPARVIKRYDFEKKEWIQASS